MSSVSRLVSLAMPFAVALALSGSSALAAGCPPPRDSGCEGTECTVVWVDCAGGGPAPPSKKSLPVGTSHSPVVIYVPACSGNGPTTGDGTCGAAVNSCVNPGDFRFFVYTRTWTGSEYGPPVLRPAPSSVCLGPVQAARLIDPTVSIAALVRAEWRSFGLPGASVRTRPEGETLVGAATQFSTEASPQPTVPPKRVLGRSVQLHVKARQYVWDFGDGTSLTVDASGARPSASHTYRSAGEKAVRLSTMYTADFTIAGSPATYPLEGTATVPGQVTLLTAREARTQLEAGSADR